jgi:hypothetical protein
MTSTHFHIFVIIPPLKRIWQLILTNLNSLHTKIICTKFHWNRFAGSGEQDYKKKFSVFSLFRYYIPLHKGNPLHLNKLEPPSPKDNLCQVWLNLAELFWRRCRKCKSLQTTDRRQTTGDQKSSLNLYRATPAVIRYLRFSGLIRRTALFICLLRHTRGCGGCSLTRILTGKEW